MGFRYPSFGLSTVPQALRDVPYSVAGVAPEPATSYSSVTCDQDHTSGFASEEVRALGVGPDLVQPKDWRVYERFIGVSAGRAIAGAADIALEVRRQLFGEPWAELTGHVQAPVGPSMVTTGERAMVLVSQGTEAMDVQDRTPVTDAIPDENGVEHLDVQPPGTLTGDFHVHGGPSFDSAINDDDRVEAFLASGIQVIAATEHDVAWDYADAMQWLHAYDRMHIMVGTQSTGHILFDFIPDDPNPKVIGHWNSWPLRLDTPVDLADLLPQGQDAWVVVEAGPPHRLSADLDCNGFPDTSDNNDDGEVDWRDVDGLDVDPGVDCLSETGPLNVREVPTDREDPLYWFAQVFPDGYPLAITNPLLLDVDGDGFHPVFQPAWP